MTDIDINAALTIVEARWRRILDYGCGIVLPDHRYQTSIPGFESDGPEEIFRAVDGAAAVERLRGRDMDDEAGFVSYVAGRAVESIREEIVEIVDFLRNPLDEDTFSRMDPCSPDRTLVFAAVDAWDEQAEGAGYAALRAAHTFGLLGILDIR